MYAVLTDVPIHVEDQCSIRVHQPGYNSLVHTGFIHALPFHLTSDLRRRSVRR